MVSDKLIKELQEIIKTRYGKNLTFEEVAKIANDLIEVFDVIAKIDFKEKQNE